MRLALVALLASGCFVPPVEITSGSCVGMCQKCGIRPGEETDGGTFWDCVIVDCVTRKPIVDPVNQ